MPNYINLREYFQKWSRYTFRQGVDFSRRCKNNNVLRQHTMRILQQQKLIDKKMNGNSVEGIPYVYEHENTYIRFTEVFTICMENYLTPVEYIICTIEKLLDQELGDDLMLELVGRAYRAFPSFIREYDLQYQLAREFGHDNVKHSSIHDDVVGHEDVTLFYDGSIYHIWSYQMSKRGLINTGQRITERRGVLKRGKHILCPIDVFSDEVTMIEGWSLYPEEYSTRVKEYLDNEKPDEYADIKVLSRDRLDTYMKKLHLFYKS